MINVRHFISSFFGVYDDSLEFIPAKLTAPTSIDCLTFFIKLTERPLLMVTIYDDRDEFVDKIYGDNDD